MDSKPSVIKVPAIRPVVVKKGHTISILKNNLPNNDILMRCIKLGAVTKDQIIYKSLPDDFLRGEFPSLTLVRRYNGFNKTSSTIAKFVTNDGDGSIIEKNSNEVIKVIGQNNYDTVFSAISSVISQELRIRALLALLTVEGSNKKKEISVQTEKTFADFACQTDETSKNILDYFKQRRRVKRQQFRPYVVKSDVVKLKKVVIDPNTLWPDKKTNPSQSNTSVQKPNETTNKLDETTKPIIKTEANNAENETFPELCDIINEDSNFSDNSIGNVSLTSQLSVNHPQLLKDPYSLFQNVDDHTENLNIVPLTLLDGSVIMVCAKPMDKFHWATPEILKNLSYADQAKLMYQQAFIHWKYCLERDEDGYLPIHQAVMSNDIDFLKRQCAALRKKYGSVDIPAAGNMTALQMSIFKDGERCAALLLQNGADPCAQDDEGKSFFHTAAEVSSEHLRIALNHCKDHAREMLMEDESLWNPVMENQPDEQLAKFLLDHISIMCDNQGYTPLMLASKQGNYSSVSLLLAASPDTVNRPMPNSGSSALYLAVEAACVDTSNNKNQSKISENFLKTIEILMEGGGDPGLENHFGSSVNILLTEFNIVDLSVLIANKLTAVKYFNGRTFAVNNINSLMLIKNSNGNVGLSEIRSKKANSESKNVDSPCTSNKIKSKTKSNNIISKDNNNKEKKKNDTAKDNKSKSTVEIKEIKTLTPNEAVSVNIERKKQNLSGISTPVNIKPSHFIIVPKTAKPKIEAPKYVRILPKLNTPVKNNKIVNSVAYETNTQNIDKLSKPATEMDRKHKQDTDSGQTAVKKRRKDTKPSSGKKIIKSLNILVEEATYNDGN